MSFKSNDFNANATSYVSKIMNPGTVLARIVDIKFDIPPYNKDAYSLVVTLEGEDQGDDFQGIAKDKTNPTLGNYRGQIANVRSGRYPFSDYNFQGKDITRDEQIFKWVNNLAKQMGVLEAMNAAGVEGDTIEEYVENVKKFLIKDTLWGMFTIGGAEYYTEGYDRPNYRLFFPKMSNKQLPYSAVKDEDGNYVSLLQFNKDEHIIVKADDAAPVDNFSPSGSSMEEDDMFPSGPQDTITDLNLPM
jgi:hypothetical protein